MHLVLTDKTRLMPAKEQVIICYTGSLFLLTKFEERCDLYFRKNVNCTNKIKVEMFNKTMKKHIKDYLITKVKHNG